MDIKLSKQRGLVLTLIFTLPLAYSFQRGLCTQSRATGSLAVFGHGRAAAEGRHRDSGFLRGSRSRRAGGGADGGRTPGKRPGGQRALSPPHVALGGRGGYVYACAPPPPGSGET